MEAAMEAGVDENVSDEDAAQKSMQYLLFSYTAKDDSGESKTLSDDEKESTRKKH
jgi:trigger factor/foldase protein PrsA